MLAFSVAFFSSLTFFLTRFQFTDLLLQFSVIVLKLSDTVAQVDVHLFNVVVTTAAPALVHIFRICRCAQRGHGPRADISPLVSTAVLGAHF